MNLTRRAFLAATAAATAQTGASRPNILLINTDDQRFDTVNNPAVQTPNLNRLSARGTTFRNLYSQGGMVGAMCLPSRTMLLTGRTVWRIPERNQPPGQLAILPTTFEKAGYSTFHVGKRGNTYVPASEAFQTHLYAEDLSKDRAEQSEKHADAVIAEIEKQKGPFLIYMAPPVPHDPRVAPKRFMDMYDPGKIDLPANFMPEHPWDNGDLKIRDEMLAAFPRSRDEMRKHLAEYYATITCLDFHIGRIFAKLEQTGRAKNTIILFTSDQGLAVGGRHGLMGKQNLYEHFKSPLLIAGPGIPKGSSDALVYMHDLFPTLCSLAGIEIPGSVEGQSLKPIIDRRQSSVRQHLFAVYKDVQRMVRDDRYKLIWYPKADRVQLFDLKSDPWELNNLAEREPQRVAALKKVMAQQQDLFGDKFAPRPS